MPRSASMWNASSLLLRTRPGSLAPAHLTFVLTIRCASEFQEHYARQTDARARGHWRLQVTVALFTACHLDAGRRLHTIDRGPQLAQVLEEKLPARRIAAQAAVFARHVGQRFQFDVGPVIAPPAAHHDFVFGHAISLAACAVFVLDHRQGGRVRRRVIALFRGLHSAQAPGGDALGGGSRPEFALGGQGEFRGDGDIAISSELTLPSKGELGSGSTPKRIATRRLGGVESTKQSYDASPDAAALAVIEYEDSTGRKTYRMTKDEIVVGRGGRDYWTDIKLETLPDVSREHCRLRRDPASGQFFLKDLSQLGTTIDGVKAPSSIEMAGGEKRGRNLEAPVPARARIGLAGVVFLEFRSTSNG